MIEGMVDRCGIRLLESELVVVVWLYGVGGCIETVCSGIKMYVLYIPRCIKVGGDLNRVVC